MPALDWIGKKAVVNHHREVPYRLIHCDGEQSSGDPDAGNLLVQGDNLEVLKALLPYYAGKVKCIYIDPPYNTGNESWVYNDNVNSPEIKKWIGSVVGKEAEDLSRHDKWLCMIYPRLRLLKDFLREDGVIFISIDDNEQANLKILCGHIFGEKNFLSQLIWNLGSGTQAGHFARSHEYVFAYAKNKESLSNFKDSSGGYITDRAVKKISQKNPASEVFFPEGSIGFVGDDAIFENEIGEGEKQYITNGILSFKNGLLDKNVTIKAGWTMKCQLQSWLDGNETYDTKGQKIVKFYFNAKGILWYEKDRSVINPKSVLPKEVKNTKHGTDEIINIFGSKVMDFPKPTTLIEFLIKLVSHDNDLILDSFAGSGTTGHAVLNLNKDGGNRRFILVEMDKKIANDVTAKRLSYVINGYNKCGDPSQPIKGLGSGFKYCNLGVPLFNEYGDIDAGVNFPDLAAHIFFAECGVPIPQKASDKSSYLGYYQDKAIYLLFSPSQPGFAREASNNVLTPDMLVNLPNPPEDFKGNWIVYGEGCTVGKERLAEVGIVFKQIPYQIEGM